MNSLPGYLVVLVQVLVCKLGGLELQPELIELRLNLFRIEKEMKMFPDDKTLASGNEDSALQKECTAEDLMKPGQMVFIRSQILRSSKPGASTH